MGRERDGFIALLGERREVCDDIRSEIFEDGWVVVRGNQNGC